MFTLDSDETVELTCPEPETVKYTETDEDEDPSDADSAKDNPVQRTIRAATSSTASSERTAPIMVLKNLSASGRTRLLVTSLSSPQSCNCR